MAKSIRWAPHAINDLESTCNRISIDSQFYATRFAQRVVTIIKSIPTMPNAGRVVPEYNTKEIRERIFGNYRIIYRIKPEIIEIAAVSHSARLLPELSNL